MKKILMVYGDHVDLKKIAALTETPKIYQNNGFEVTYLFKGTPDKDLKNYLSGVNIITYDGLDDIFPINKSVHFFHNRYYTFLYQRITGCINKIFLKKAISRVLNNEQFKYIYLMGPDSIISFKPRKYKNTKIIHRFFGTWDLYDLMNKKKPKILLYNSTIKAMKSFCDLAILTNDGTCSNIVYKKFNKSKYLFLWDGVKKVGENIDLGLFKENIEKKHGIQLGGSNILLSVSRLVHIKRVDRIIKIFYEYFKINENSYLIIVGDGPERKKLEKLVKLLGIQNKVLFEGIIPQKEVYKYLKLTDVFLSTYNVSNLGNPLLEALDAEKIIFTLDVGGTRDIITHKKNGFIYKLNKGYEFNMAKDIDFVLKNSAFKENILRELIKTKQNIQYWEERIAKEIKEINRL